ncbi:hypothetical protein NQZ68_007541 [Dissostichus eleginoides]|nr:hypothetical protein NQZ68_007541 [Dissostichus eleginoides]
MWFAEIERFKGGMRTEEKSLSFTSIASQTLHPINIYHLVIRELRPSTSSLPRGRRHHRNQPPACLTSIIPGHH